MDRASPPAVELDREQHVYRVAGRVLPSVTDVLGILQDFSHVDDDVLERARQFGQHVHQAINLFNRDELDWQSLHPALVPFVERWRAFLAQSGAVVIASEKPVVHEKLGYAGTPDVVLAWSKRTVIPDIKVTAAVPRTVGAQTAAYAKAYQAMHGGREPARCCIHLTDGRYRVHARTDPADWSIFLSALNCWRFIHAA